MYALSTPLESLMHWHDKQPISDVTGICKYYNTLQLFMKIYNAL